MKHAVDILEYFGIFSGLLTNRAKYMVIELDYRGSHLSLDTKGLTLIATSASCRYLGVLVGQRDRELEQVYSIVMVSARPNQGETHTVEQRAVFPAPMWYSK